MNQRNNNSYKLLPYTLCVSLLLVGNIALYAQNEIPTQYLSAPMFLNPAATGACMPDDVRWGVNVHNSPFSSSNDLHSQRNIFADFCALKLRLPMGDALGFGVGVQVENTKANAIKSSRSCIGVAYHKNIGSSLSHLISVGIQASIVQRRLNYNILTQNDFYRNGKTGLLSDNYPVEDLESNITHPEFNAGVQYVGFLGKKWDVFAGGAVHNFTTPNDVISGFSPAPTHSAWVAYTGANFDANKHFSFKASVCYRAIEAQNTIKAHFAAGYLLNPQHDVEVQFNRRIYIGAYYQKDAYIAPSLLIEWDRYLIGISKDMYQSNSTLSNQSDLELSVNYTFALKKTNILKNMWMIPQGKF
ncbi:MAG: type IX secretion system membrane protein PorP/SprF [Chitinophagia bacterium]|nr:type IX secretion system membrane protein PorP/SprF [Chitinophagia bacterium]